MDGQQQPSILHDKAARCLQQLQNLKQRTEKGLHSHKTAPTPGLLRGVRIDVNDSLRLMQSWMSQLEQGEQTDSDPVVTKVVDLLDSLSQSTIEALAALNSRLRYRKLLVLGFIVHRRQRFERHLSQALKEIADTVGELLGLLKVVLVVSGKQAVRDQKKTVALEGTSHPNRAFREFFDSIDSTDSHTLLSSALRILWDHLPYWQELDGRVGNADDPGDGLLYDEEHVAKANSILHDLYQVWLHTEALADHHPPSNLPKIGKICLVLTGMRQPSLLQDFVDSGYDDQALPFKKDRLMEILRPEHRDHAATFAAEQYRAVQREWRDGQHLEIDEEEPLPLKFDAPYDKGSYGNVYRVKDLSSGHYYARKDQITVSGQGSAAARRHLEEENRRLKDLEHRHIVQVVKTYQRGPAYGILLRPAATSDLQKLLGRNTKDKFNSEKGCKDSVWLRQLFLTAFGCLSHGLAYIHGRDIRHKDVKPANILYEKALPTNNNAARFLWADFGLAYDFSETGNSKTRSTKIYSPRYAAPEIVAASSRAENEDRRASSLGMSNLNQIVEDGEELIVEEVPASPEADAHGRSADVFSLGCVFFELLAGLVKEKLPLKKHDPSDEKLMFSRNVPVLLAWAQAWIERLEKQEDCTELKPLFGLAIWMISREPNKRPLVDAVLGTLIKAQVDAQISGAKPDYFCKVCWEELEKQGNMPPKGFKKPPSAESPPSPTSPITPRRSTGVFLLKRVHTNVSIKNVRPRISRILSSPSSPIKAT